MRKIVFIMLLIFLPMVAFCEKNPFSYKTIIQGLFGFPLTDFGMEAGTGDEDYNVDAVLGGQIGSKFYILKNSAFGAGIYVNWVEFTYSNSPLSVVEKMTITETSLLETGIIGSYHFLDEYTLDLYYQIRPTFMINSLETNYFKYPAADDYGLYDTVRRWALGISHVVGLGFNFDIFSFGAEFGFGAVSHFYPEILLGNIEGQPVHPVMSLEPDLQSECLRIFLGIQL